MATKAAFQSKDIASQSKIDRPYQYGIGPKDISKEIVGWL